MFRSLILAVSLMLLTITSAQAEMRLSKRLDFKNIRRLISLDQATPLIENTKSSLQFSEGTNGYLAEFERGVSGRLMAYQEADIGISVGVGVGFEAGAFIIGKKKVANKAEADIFLDGDYLKAIDPDRFDEWEKGESYKYILEGALILDPTIEMFGIWTVIKGSWSIEVEKISVSKVSLTVNLLNSNTASFYFDALWNMVSIDIGNSLSKGRSFIFDLDSEEGRHAYNQVFHGNLKSAQSYAVEGQGVELLSEEQSKGHFKGTSLYSRSPWTAWYLMTFDFRIEEFEKKKEDFKNRTTENELSANYVEDQKLTLFKYYHAKLRQFSSSYNLKSKELKMSDEWNEEFNRSFDGQLKGAYANLKQKVQIPQLPDLNISQEGIKGYTHLKFNYTYSLAFFRHLQSSTIDFDKLAKKSVEDMVKARMPQTKYYAMGTGPYIAEQIEQGKVLIPLAVKNIEKLAKKLQRKTSDNLDAETLKILAQISKSAYYDPYLYKNWLQLAINCGGKLDLQIEGENIKQLNHSKFFEVSESCFQ